MPPKRIVSQRRGVGYGTRKVSTTTRTTTGTSTAKRKGTTKRQKLPKFPKKRPNAMFYVTLGCMLYRYILDPFMNWYYGGSETTSEFSNGNHEMTMNSMINPNASKVIFYHLHDAKTAGSSLNRYMARRYYAVCGHKGYSYDQLWRVGNKLRIDGGFGPDRVQWSKMEEMGYHNCKFISNEVNVGGTVTIVNYLQKIGYQVHILVPCREPITHRISKCVYLELPLKEWSLKQEDDEFCSNIIHRCVIDENRYDIELEKIADNVTYFYYKDFAFVDNIVQGYVPKRGVVLPDYNKTYETGSHYDKELVKEIKSRCGKRINRHFINSQPMYTQCAKHLPREMKSVPP